MPLSRFGVTWLTNDFSPSLGLHTCTLRLQRFDITKAEEIAFNLLAEIPSLRRGIQNLCFKQSDLDCFKSAMLPCTGGGEK
jgi:hypothetical protein